MIKNRYKQELHYPNDLNQYGEGIEFIKWNDGRCSILIDLDENKDKKDKDKDKAQKTLDTLCNQPIINEMQNLRYGSKLLMMLYDTDRYDKLKGLIMKLPFRYMASSLRATSNANITINIQKGSNNLNIPNGLTTLFAYNTFAYRGEGHIEYYSTLLISKYDKMGTSYFENARYFIRENIADEESNEDKVRNAIKAYIENHFKRSSDPVIIYKMIRKKENHGREYYDGFEDNEIYYCVSDVFGLLLHNLPKKSGRGKSTIAKSDKILWFEEDIDDKMMVIGAGYSPKTPSDKLYYVVYSHPTILYRYISKEKYNENKKEIKDKLISTLLFGMALGDEKGGLSNIGLKRLFVPTHPDFGRKILPSLYILGYEGEYDK